VVRASPLDPPLAANVEQRQPGGRLRTRGPPYFFTTESVTSEGYCFEWWITLCATTPEVSS
jgi:hypothetical protein